MSNINKLPASAGAEWLLAGFTLLRKAPLALGMLGVIWGMVTTLVMLLANAVPALFMAAQLLMVLGWPLFMAAMVYAAAEVDQGRPALPAHLLQPLRDGHGLALLIASLLPQVVAALGLGLLLFLMIGVDELRHLGEVWHQLQVIAAAGGQPDPALVASLPAGRLLLWLLLVVVVVVAIKWMTFIVAPQILFEGRDAITAMRTSLRGCVQNWTAMLVYYLLSGVAIFAIMFASLLLASIAQLIGGAAFAVLLWQLLLLAVLMPVLAGSVYAAWRQMLGQGQAMAGSPPPASGRIEV